MRIKLGVLVGVMTVVALAGGSSAAVASDGGGPTHDRSGPGDQRVAAIGVALDGPVTQQRADKFAQCMRDNGVPNFETPKVTPPSGDEPGRLESVLPKDVDPEAVRKATEKCAPAAPAERRIPASDVKKLKRYAKCMRDNGLENFPTPRADGSLRLGKSIDPESEEFQAAEEACEKYAPARRVKKAQRPGHGEPVLHAGRAAA